MPAMITMAQMQTQRLWHFAAYVSVDDEKSAEDAYNKLMLFYNKETGGFNSNYDDVLATKDAIFGLSYYWLLADFDDDTDNDENDNSTGIDKPTKPIVNVTEKRIRKILLQQTNPIQAVLRQRKSSKPRQNLLLQAPNSSLCSSCYDFCRRCNAYNKEKEK